MSTTAPYDITYADGTERTKLLSEKDADKLEDSKNVKSVSKRSNKQRKASKNKGD